MLEKSSKAYQRLADLMVGAKIALALRACAEHKVADHLANGPQSADQLANELDLNSSALRRVLRALSQFDVFKETQEGVFENTEVSEMLRSDVEESLREAILFLNSDVSLDAWQRIEHSLEDGRSRFIEVNGAPLFDLFKSNKKLSEYFGKFMVNIYGTQGTRIAMGYPFGEFNRLIDVGGGPGHILAAILSAHPGLHGTLFDIEPTAVLAREFLEGRGLSERCNVIGGDFFVEVPGGYDAYIVKSVLHDWDDLKATEILKKCRNAMSEKSRLLIVEEVIVPQKTVGNPHKFVDMDLFVHLGGGERTENEYQDLMNNSGFTLDRVIPIKDSFFSVIVGGPT